MYAISREITRTHRTAPTDDMIVICTVDRFMDSVDVGFESSKKIKRGSQGRACGPR